MFLQETIFGPSLLRDERHDRDLGEAHVLLAKSAADATISYGLSGRLTKTDKNWVMLSVPNALVRGAFDALHEIGAELPLNSEGRLFGHISVMTPTEVEQIGGVDKIDELGHTFGYSLGPVKTCEPDGWKDVAQVWFITINSPELSKLRRSYGLSDTPKYPFHTTFARRMKGTMAHNSQVSKAAAEKCRNYKADECCPHCCVRLERDPDSGRCNGCGEDWPMKKSAIDEYLQQEMPDEYRDPGSSSFLAGESKLSPINAHHAEAQRLERTGGINASLWGRSEISEPKPGEGWTDASAVKPMVGRLDDLANSKPIGPNPGLTGVNPYLIGGGLALGLGGIGAGFLWNRSRKKRQEAEVAKNSAADDYLQRAMVDDLENIQRDDELTKLAGWMDAVYRNVAGGGGRVGRLAGRHPYIAAGTVGAGGLVMSPTLRTGAGNVTGTVLDTAEAGVSRAAKGIAERADEGVQDLGRRVEDRVGAYANTLAEKLKNADPLVVGGVLAPLLGLRGALMADTNDDGSTVNRLARGGIRGVSTGLGTTAGLMAAQRYIDPSMSPGGRLAALGLGALAGGTLGSFGGGLLSSRLVPDRPPKRPAENPFAKLSSVVWDRNPYVNATPHTIDDFNRLAFKGGLTPQVLKGLQNRVAPTDDMLNYYGLKDRGSFHDAYGRLVKLDDKEPDPVGKLAPDPTPWQRAAPVVTGLLGGLVGGAVGYGLDRHGVTRSDGAGERPDTRSLTTAGLGAAIGGLSGAVAGGVDLYRRQAQADRKRREARGLLSMLQRYGTDDIIDSRMLFPLLAGQSPDDKTQRLSEQLLTRMSPPVQPTDGAARDRTPLPSHQK